MSLQPQSTWEEAQSLLALWLGRRRRRAERKGSPALLSRVTPPKSIASPSPKRCSQAPPGPARARQALHGEAAKNPSLKSKSHDSKH